MCVLMDDKTIDIVTIISEFSISKFNSSVKIHKSMLDNETRTYTNF